MAEYTVLRQVAVRSKNGEEATVYNTYGETVDIPDKQQADDLVAGGYVEPVAETKRAAAEEKKAAKKGRTSPVTVTGGGTGVEGPTSPDTSASGGDAK